MREKVVPGRFLETFSYGVFVFSLGCSVGLDWEWLKRGSRRGPKMGLSFPGFYLRSICF